VSPVLVLASFGRSLGIRRIYVQALLNIFQVSTIEKLQPFQGCGSAGFDVDPDPISMLMPIQIRHQNSADSQADPSPSLTNHGK
jgi:hypothetical protein